MKLAGGQEIRTTWGALAWQLGKQKAYNLVAEHDASGIAPGSNLLEALFKAYAPCLVLIDEWVAYLRQIYKVDGLPSGSFDANLSFVQALSEAVKTSPRTCWWPPCRRPGLRWAAKEDKRPWLASSRPSAGWRVHGAPLPRKRATKSCGGDCSREPLN